MPDDQTIIGDIRTVLDGDSRVDHAREIAISSHSGWVLLRGTVGSPRQRGAAIEIAKSVAGVRNVADELRVDLRDRWEDGELRGVALQALIADASVPADRIEVAVSDGWLTLKGEVKHQAASDAAFAIVSRLPGAGGITNEIRVITAGIDG